MNFLKGRGELIALIALLLIIFTWLKSDISAIRADMATKEDIARVEADIARVEADLKADIARVETNLKVDITDIRNLLIDHI